MKPSAEAKNSSISIRNCSSWRCTSSGGGDGTPLLAAVEHGAHIVVGTSGLSEEDYAEIDTAALRHVRGVLAVGNFALTVVLMQKFAEMAARLEERVATHLASGALCRRLDGSEYIGV